MRSAEVFRFIFHGFLPMGAMAAEGLIFQPGEAVKLREVSREMGGEMYELKEF